MAKIDIFFLYIATFAFSSKSLCGPLDHAVQIWPHHCISFSLLILQGCGQISNGPGPYQIFPVTKDGKLMMEYIGATGKPVKFSDVPIGDNIDFHFILGFAIDSDPSGNPQNGTFSSYWASTLTPESVAAIKTNHPNVKVLASLSGWSLGKKVLNWYIPDDPQLWISNAFTSLKSIVENYHLDGIDIDYERFGKNNESFGYCIGELITLLKNHGVISIATIAPFYSTVIPYINLYQNYSGVIDYVNYQFYTDRVSTPKGYLEAFKLRTEEFDMEKVLPSYEVNGRGIQGDAFFDALSLLQENGFNFSGVMIFCADASATDDYYYERKVQEFLLNSTHI